MIHRIPGEYVQLQTARGWSREKRNFKHRRKKGRITRTEGKLVGL